MCRREKEQPPLLGWSRRRLQLVSAPGGASRTFGALHALEGKGVRWTSGPAAGFTSSRALGEIFTWSLGLFLAAAVLWPRVDKSLVVPFRLVFGLSSRPP